MFCTYLLNINYSIPVLKITIIETLLGTLPGMKQRDRRVAKMASKSFYLLKRVYCKKFDNDY